MTGSVRIKICGVRNPEDALAAVDAGADLIGVNFVAGSPREVDVKQAMAICEALEGQDVERVALFRDAELGQDRRDPASRILRTRAVFTAMSPKTILKPSTCPTIKAIRGADQEAAAKRTQARSFCSIIRIPEVASVRPGTGAKQRT